MTRRALLPALIAAAAIGVIGVVVTLAVGMTRDDEAPVAVAYAGSSFGMTAGVMGGGIMGPFWSGSLDEAQPLESMEGAQARVEEWLRDGGFEGFEVAEVMAFTNGYCAAVTDGQGAGGFELLVDPATGWVSPEPGPNMMWNTEYGMMGGRLAGGMIGGGSTGMMGGGMMGADPGTAPEETLSPQDARALADRWLDDALPGETAGEPISFPGYYTLDTERNGRVEGMLSVHAQTGAVWYHVWHGTFLDELEA